MNGLMSGFRKAAWLAKTVLRSATVRLPSARMGSRVATILPRLSLACCEGVALEIGSRATLTFRKSLCLVVLREVHGGVGFSTVEEPGVVAHEVAVVAWRGS